MHQGVCIVGKGLRILEKLSPTSASAWNVFVEEYPNNKKMRTEKYLYKNIKNNNE